MAEELDIRSLWNSSKEKEDPNSLQLNMLKKKGTKTTLYWIKTILWIEFWISIAAVPIYLFANIEGYNSNSFKVFAICITLVYLVYYQFLIREINRFSYDQEVVRNLKKVYGYLRFYILHYKVVIWLSLIAGAFLSTMEPDNQEVFSKLDSTTDWLKFIGITSLLLGIVGGIMTFLIHLIYGRKIKRLKRMVKDLEREE